MRIGFEKVKVITQIKVFTIHYHFGKAFGAEVVEEIFELAFFVPDHGTEDGKEMRDLFNCINLSFNLGQGDSGDLVERELFDLGAVVWTFGVANTSIEQTEVVVDLGRGTDGRSRVVRDGLLVNGNARREAIDPINIGLVHETQKLAGITRERLDVATLALGVDGVEGEARLARARDAGHDDKLIFGDIKIDVFEVVLARTADRDVLLHSVCVILQGSTL